ncbi:hypothetical protein [Aquisalimonas sp.]|uniref:hypothetical protein n=1 Tax=Aquisalimonas sp. TaxID=1872621 RepID=UPI0025C56332|nr:hypothetical protein [Aquisalimonas sp.]
MQLDGWIRAVGLAALLTLVAACEFESTSGTSGGNGSADASPSDWWKCPQRVGGTWTFGRAPYGCDVEEFGSAAVVRSNFDAYIFDDDEPQDSERIRYMGALYAFLADQAADYLRSRRADASDAEVAAWRRAVYATAHQESFWTHYREASASAGRLLTMLRGDNGHGHGLMQVDDRFHTNAIQSGIGWRLDENLSYALDIYYEAWQRAPRQWCVSSPNAWDERARSAYSAYNGGRGQICRWTDPNHTWARNDEGFYDKYVRQQWQFYASG